MFKDEEESQKEKGKQKGNYVKQQKVVEEK